VLGVVAADAEDTVDRVGGAFALDRNGRELGRGSRRAASRVAVSVKVFPPESKKG
jgi:hypothetical protein